MGEQYDFEVVWLDHASIEGLDLCINYSPVNSLGLAGTLFVKNQEQMNIIKEHKPLTILRHVASA